MVVNRELQNNEIIATYQSAGLKFLRRIKRCTRRDHTRNEDIREELNMYNLNEKIEEYMGCLLYTSRCV